MLNSNTKKQFAKLNLKHPAIALKYHAVKPLKVSAYQGQTMAFCMYLKHAQQNEETFYIIKDNDECYGKMALGMIPMPAVTASGQAGYDFEIYRTPMACQQLYQKLPVLVHGTINYVQFAQVAACDFNPDLIVCVTDFPQAEILMRATSYISGDLWESKSSPVLSCAWMYAYPIISGKVNHITTGYYHGLKRRKAYPPGLRIIAIPYQKIDEVTTALDEMPWTPIAFREDERSKAELEQRMNHWQEMASDLNCTVDIR